MQAGSGNSATAAGSTGTSGPAPQATGIVRLRDVVTQTPEGMPRVELGSQQYDQSCTVDGRPSVAVDPPTARLQAARSKPPAASMRR